MKDALPRDLIERLLERKYPDWKWVYDSVFARRTERVYVSRRDAALYAEIKAYEKELRSRPTEELLDLYEQEASPTPETGANEVPAASEPTETERLNRAVSATLTERARRAANAAHEKDRAMREQAIAHYRSHRNEYRNKDRAADAIAGKIVPAAFSTVRRWLRNI